MSGPKLKLDTPRVAALEPEEWDDDARALLGRGGDPAEVTNAGKTLARHSKLLKRWNPLIMHTMRKSELSARDTELVILRVAHLCDCGYEWAQHEVMAREAGLDDADYARVIAGAGAEGWSGAEAALLCAVDELKAETHISHQTWARLTHHFETKQIMDIVATTGAYVLLAMALNSFGVQLEEKFRN